MSGRGRPRPPVVSSRLRQLDQYLAVSSSYGQPLVIPDIPIDCSSRTVRKSLEYASARPRRQQTPYLDTLVNKWAPPSPPPFPPRRVYNGLQYESRTHRDRIVRVTEPHEESTAVDQHPARKGMPTFAARTLGAQTARTPVTLPREVPSFTLLPALPPQPQDIPSWALHLQPTQRKRESTRKLQNKKAQGPREQLRVQLQARLARCREMTLPAPPKGISSKLRIGTVHAGHDQHAGDAQDRVADSEEFSENTNYLGKRRDESDGTREESVVQIESSYPSYFGIVDEYGSPY